MLDKITNINPESGYKNEKHGGNFIMSFSKVSKHPELGNDAIQISPALHNLLEKGWRLIELKEINPRKVFIKFLFAEFIFQVEVDFDKLLSTKKLLYNITKEKKSFGKNRKIMLSLTFNINKYFQVEDNLPILVSLRDMEILLERISQLELEAEINNFDTYAIKSLMDEIYKGLIIELNYISTNLLLFFEKFTKINCHFISQEEDIPEIIKLEKIFAVDLDKAN
jgi:hypothetical protein